VRIALLLLAFALTTAAPAAAAEPSGGPLRLWSVSAIDQGAGRVQVDGGAQADGALDQTVDLGRVAFNLHGTPLFDRASGRVFSSATGRSYSVEATAPTRDFSRPQSARGGATHLDEYQAYVKRSDSASLRITLSQAELVNIDGNSALAHCTAGLACRPVRSIVRFHARAYAASAGGDFYDAGAAAHLEGRRGHWGFAVATAADSRTPVWTKAAFGDDPDFDADVHDQPTGMGADLYLDHPVTLRVPLGSVRTGELFAVHVSLDAQAVNDLGREGAATAFISDPQELAPGILNARGLQLRGAPAFREPAIRALRPARCPHRRSGRAGTLQLSSAAFAAGEGDGDALVLVTRQDGSRGAASARLATRAGTATAGADYKPTTTTVRFGAGDTGPRLVDIPLREDAAVEPAETFTVALSQPRCAGLGRRTAAVTIDDDDDAPPPPAPPPAPAPAPSPAPAPAPPPSGLDPTFGDGGRGAVSALHIAVADESGLDDPSGMSPLRFVGAAATAQAAAGGLDGAPAAQTARLCLRIALQGRARPLGFCATSVAEGDMPDTLAQQVDGAFGLLDANTFARLRIARVSIAMTLHRGLGEAWLQSATGPRAVRPGGRATIVATVRHFRGPRTRLRLRLAIPRSARPGRLMIRLRGTATPPDAPDESLADVIKSALSAPATGDDPPASLPELAARIAALGHDNSITARIGRALPTRVYRSRALEIFGRTEVPLRVVAR
jgi:hypothetical protein